MKKGKFAGLAVCALAFAAVAGAISAHAVNAKEANAGSEKTLYCKVSQSWWKTDGAAVGAHYWKDGVGGGTTWPGLRMAAVAGEEDMWSITVDTSKYDRIIFVRVNSSGNIADWGAKTANLIIPTDGNNLYTITSSSAVWGDPGVTGVWSTYAPASSSSEEAPVASSEEQPAASSEEVILSSEEADVPAVNGHYLVGDATFTGSEATAWKFAGGILSDMKEGSSNIAEWHNVEIAKDAVVKGRFYYGPEDTNWIAPVLDKEYSFVGLVDDGLGGNNVQFSVAGTYSIYLYYSGETPVFSVVDEGAAAVESSEAPAESSAEADVPAEEGYYLVGSHSNWKYAGAYADDKDELSTNIAEFKNKEIAANQVVKVRSYIGGVDTWHLLPLDKEYSFVSMVTEEGEDYGNLVFSVAGTYSIYVFEWDEAWKISVVDEGAVESSEEPVASSEEEFVDESLAGRYYIIGEGSFNKDGIPTWSYKSGILLDEPTGESTDLAVGHEVALKAGDVIKFRVGQAPKDQGYIGYSAIEVGDDLFNNDENDNIVVKADSTYNIYINSESKLYIYDTQDPVVLSGHIYYGAGAGGVAFGDTYIYTWKVEGTTEVPTNPWPGVKLSTLAGVRHSTMLNFAGSDGSVFEIPGTSLGDATHFIINNGDDVQTADFEYADGRYYSLTYSAGKGDANLAAPAKLALDIDLAIDGAKDSSLCNMDADLGKDIKNDYDKLSAVQKVLVDGSTFYTINVNSSGEEDKKIDVYGSDIIHMIDKAVIASPESPLFSTKAIGEENKALYITLTAVGIATAIGIAVYVIQRKKRHQ